MKSKTGAARLVAAIFVATLALAGCGGGESAPTPSSGPSALGGDQTVDDLDELYTAAKDAGETQVVVYGGLAESFQDVYAAFEARYPEIDVVTQPLFGAELFARVEQEFSSGQRVADLVHVGGPAVLPLRDAGQLEPFAPANADVTSEDWQAPDDTFVLSALQPFGVVYNTDEVSDADAPASWTSLASSDWSDETVLADPTLPGGTSEVVSTLLHDGQLDIAIFDELNDNGTQLDADWATMLQTVATGSKQVGFGPPYPVVAQFIEKGAPIAFKFPMEGDNAMSPIGFGLLQDAPQPNAAKLLASWIFTPEAQELIGNAGFYGTQKGDYGTPENLPALSSVDVAPLPPIDDRAALLNSTIEDLTSILH